MCEPKFLLACFMLPSIHLVPYHLVVIVVNGGGLRRCCSSAARLSFRRCNSRALPNFGTHLLSVVYSKYLKKLGFQRRNCRTTDGAFLWPIKVPEACPDTSDPNSFIMLIMSAIGISDTLVGRRASPTLLVVVEGFGIDKLPLVVVVHLADADLSSF